MKDLYTEHYNTLMKEIEDIDKCKNMPCSQTGRINIVKMSVIPKLIYRFHVIPIKITVAVFTEIEKQS